ncbi:HAD family hydrolase [Aliidiomarina haloalkalitolerans]|uniref:HAD family hydrolase n=1 Tax=Aliidiomarina haloalkalitolerans TaxID=859059 RepID=A0A432VYH9_9GAMM|nr:HAD-IA family hydrolase [Aliidiomarina haloalkalitolerans]RUO21718.1 HAD family hydrolase [Aliidiomarina haloalkalitolerans]
MIKSLNDTKLVVFDWDGTLMDSVPRIVSCMQKMAQQTGLAVPSESAVRDIIGLSLWVALERLFDCYDSDEQAKLIAVYRDLYVHKDVTPSPLFPGVREVLAELKAENFVLAVATGKARAGLDRAWHETDTASFFTSSRCADEAASKPAPQMLEEILQQTGINKANAIMVGDSCYDLQMARNAGMPAAGITWGVHDAPRLSQEQPHGIIDHIEELPQLLRQLQTVTA